MNDIKLKKCLADVMGVDISVVTDDFSAETTDIWDSLKHLVLVITLEEQFSVSFTEDQVVNMLSYQSIRNTLMDHGVEFP